MHQEILKHLWTLSFNSPPQLTSQDWVSIGFQGQDPSTDFRGGGLYSLQQIINFAQTYPNHYQEIKSADYSFAICSINLTHFLAYYFQLLPKNSIGTSECRRAGPHILKTFARLNDSDQSVLDYLHAVGVVFMNRHWNLVKLAKKVTIMDFIHSMVAAGDYIEQLLEQEPDDLNHLRRLADVLN